ncbi:MAG: tetratricopeptide repeat protein [Cyclobacteriaceae bacterium]|nr:tetratricopeptide repeat protein [Cyclobacteriaceae bacterium]
MAKVSNRKSKKPEKGGAEVLESPEALAEQLSKTEQFLEKNKVLVFSIGGVLAAIVLGIFLFRYYITNQNKEAQEQMFQAVYYFEADSLQKALHGDGINPGFLDIIDDYSMTDASNLSKFYAGASFIKLGEFDEAIQHLSKFKSKDLVIQPRALALIGDAHMELGNISEAIKFYERAANYKSNEFISPQYLIKVAIAYEKNGNLDNALKAYNTIIEKYPKSAEFQNARKHVARLETIKKNK